MEDGRRPAGRVKTLSAQGQRTHRARRLPGEGGGLLPYRGDSSPGFGGRRPRGAPCFLGWARRGRRVAIVQTCRSVSPIWRVLAAGLFPRAARGYVTRHTPHELAAVRGRLRAPARDAGVGPRALAVLPPAARRGRRASGAAARTTTTSARGVPRLEKTDLVENQRAHPPFGEFLAAPREEFGSLHTSPGPIYIPRLASERGGTPVLKEAIRAMGVRPGDVAHVTLSYHIMPGGLRLHRAFEEARLPRHQRRHRREPAPGRRWRAPTARRCTPARRASSPTSATRRARWGSTRGATSHYRVGFSTAEALTPALRRDLAGDLRHRALRPLRRGADRPARRRVPRARRHAPPRARPLLRVPRSRDAASRSAPGGTGELVATQLGPRALPLVRYAPRDVVPPARRRVSRAATRRCGSSSSGRWASSGRSRACSSIRRRCTR